MNDNNDYDPKAEYVTEEVIHRLKCLRCDWHWLPRTLGSKPLTCPKCHSSYWFRPRTREQKPKAKPTNGLDSQLIDNK